MTRFKYSLKECAKQVGKLSGEDMAGRGDSTGTSLERISALNVSGIQEKAMVRRSHWETVTGKMG